MLIVYILFCFFALFMTCRRRRRETPVRQLGDRWEEYYTNQSRDSQQSSSYSQGLRDSRTGL